MIWTITCRHVSRMCYICDMKFLHINQIFPSFIFSYEVMNFTQHCVIVYMSDDMTCVSSVGPASLVSYLRQTVQHKQTA